MKPKLKNKEKTSNEIKLMIGEYWRLLGYRIRLFNNAKEVQKEMNEDFITIKLQNDRICKLLQEKQLLIDTIDNLEKELEDNKIAYNKKLNEKNKIIRSLKNENDKDV